MVSLIELDYLITNAKLEYKIEREKLNSLEDLYLLAEEKEKEAFDNLKYIYLIHEINEDSVKQSQNKHAENILYASYLNDCDFTSLNESIKAHEQYLNKTKQNRLDIRVDCMNQHSIVIKAIQILQKASFLKATLLCKSIEKIIEEL
jgi:hypothetical protein